MILGFLLVATISLRSALVPRAAVGGLDVATEMATVFGFFCIHHRAIFGFLLNLQLGFRSVPVVINVTAVEIKLAGQRR